MRSTKPHGLLWSPLTQTCLIFGVLLYWRRGYSYEEADCLNIKGLSFLCPEIKLGKLRKFWFQPRTLLSRKYQVLTVNTASDIGWAMVYTVVDEGSGDDKYLYEMRSSLVVRASDCQCTSCNGPGFDSSIRRHSGIWGAADEAVLNIVLNKKRKNPPKKYFKKSICMDHRLNRKLDLLSLFGLHVTWCVQLFSLAEAPQPPPRIWAHKRGALLVS